MKLHKYLPIMAVLALMTVMVAPVAHAQDGIEEKFCLITDVGSVTDGTFNQFAYEGGIVVAEDLDLDFTFIETQDPVDYADNIDTCINDGAEAIITVGFLLQQDTLIAAENNPDVFFIGIDQFYPEGSPTNVAGVQFREDQGGFLVGVLAAMVAEENGYDKVGGVYGIDIPPVKKFRNGFEQGVHYINPELEISGVYVPSFEDRALGASTAEQLIGDGADIIFGAGGQTGSGGIEAAAAQEIYVIGVDKDEYFSTFTVNEPGDAPGAEFLISSAIKRVDLGVIDLITALVEGNMDAFPGGSNYVMDAAIDGVDFAPAHDSDIDEGIYEQVQEVKDLLASGELETGVDPVSGDLMDMMEDMDMDEDMDEEAMATEEADE
ncbi:MAG: BMP family lipoprotein [Aggregatilineales bacterium]